MGVTDDPEVQEALRLVARRPRPPICPNCGRREQNPGSRNGWCWTCDSDAERKRRWRDAKKEQREARQ